MYQLYIFYLCVRREDCCNILQTMFVMVHLRKLVAGWLPLLVRVQVPNSLIGRWSLQIAIYGRKPYNSPSAWYVVILVVITNNIVFQSIVYYGIDYLICRYQIFYTWNLKYCQMMFIIQVLLIKYILCLCFWVFFLIALV